MTTGTQRMEIGEQFETAIIGALRARGWYAEPFGQAMLTARMRQYMRATDTPARWLPDVIAAKRVAVQQIVYVDAKAGDEWRRTGNHDVETAAVTAAAGWADFTNCATYLAFTDWSVTTPDRALTCGRPGRWDGNGSDTPFLLISRVSVCMPFDAIFGPKETSHD